MRILVLGAGAIGGYFGGRLLEAKQDVTFLVRPRRKAELERDGLVIESPMGNVKIENPPVVLAEDLRPEYDLVVLTCKAYDLESAIESITPAMGEKTAVLPLLNGMRHLDVLNQKFDASRVLGGLCIVSTTMEPSGRIVHFNRLHGLSFGEQDGRRTERAEATAKAFSAANFDSRLSANILQEMWEKWVFIASCAGITCLMRSSIGDVVAAGGSELSMALLDECASVARSQGYEPGQDSLDQSRAVLTAARSPLVASMFRDIERGGQIEAAHLIGDLLRRGEQAGVATPLLRVVSAHLGTYEMRRAREAADVRQAGQS
jgi:2-dehydropantoate 2-reductase